jgi:hypothetical protein
VIPTKVCTRCKQEKDYLAFKLRGSGNQNLRSWCRQCDSDCQRETLKETLLRRRAWGRAHSDWYRKNRLVGKACQIFNYCRNNVNGVTPSYSFWGLPLAPRREFYRVLLSSKKFRSLFQLWVLSGHQRKYSPSIKLINHSRGYVAGNLQFVPASETIGKKFSLALAAKISKKD